MTNIPEGLKDEDKCELCRVLGVDRNCTIENGRVSRKISEGSDEPFVAAGSIRLCPVRLQIDATFYEARHLTETMKASKEKKIYLPSIRRYGGKPRT